MTRIWNSCKTHYEYHWIILNIYEWYWIIQNINILMHTAWGTTTKGSLSSTQRNKTPCTQLGPADLKDGNSWCSKPKLNCACRLPRLNGLCRSADLDWFGLTWFTIDYVWLCMIMIDHVWLCMVLLSHNWIQLICPHPQKVCLENDKTYPKHPKANVYTYAMYI